MDARVSRATSIMPSSLSRRSLLAKAATLAVAPMIVPGRVLGRDGGVAPSNRIVVAGVGIGNRGQQVLNGFLKNPDVQVVEICDVQQTRRNYARGLVNGHYGNRDCRVERDMLATYAREGIDAVLIATGDRWHALASALAAKAGLDVFCEKPCGMHIEEHRQLAETFARHKRIFQAGTQRRSVPNFQYAVGLARDGKLGKLKKVHGAILQPVSWNTPLPAEELPDPEVIDWDRWVGPSPMHPYNKQYLSRWNGFDDFTAAWRLPDWAAHTADLCQWAADADGTGPLSIEAEGINIRGKYKNGVELVLRLGGFRNEGDWNGLGTCPVRFEGEDGWVETADSGTIIASRPELLKANEGAAVIRGTDPDLHVRDFLDAVRSRGTTRCNAANTRSSHNTSFAAAVAWKLQRGLRFDPAAEDFPDDAEANAFLSRPPRAPWAFPVD
jgi:predicted dehydrogenase